MIVTIAPNMRQVRFYVQAALNGFETLDLETAAECAKSELQTLLRYLDAVDNTGEVPATVVRGESVPTIEVESAAPSPAVKE